MWVVDKKGLSGYQVALLLRCASIGEHVTTSWAEAVGTLYQFISSNCEGHMATISAMVIST